jgi:hypothetical protein
MRVSHRRKGRACGNDLGTTTCRKGRNSPVHQVLHDRLSTATKVALPFWPSSGCLDAHSLPSVRGLGLFHRNSTLLENHPGMTPSMGFRQVSPQIVSDIAGSGRLACRPVARTSEGPALRVDKVSATNVGTLRPLVLRRLELHPWGGRPTRPNVAQTILRFFKTGGHNK